MHAVFLFVNLHLFSKYVSLCIGCLHYSFIVSFWTLLSQWWEKKNLRLMNFSINLFFPSMPCPHHGSPFADVFILTLLLLCPKCGFCDHNLDSYYVLHTLLIARMPLRKNDPWSSQQVLQFPTALAQNGMLNLEHLPLLFTSFVFHLKLRMFLLLFGWFKNKALVICSY